MDGGKGRLQVRWTGLVWSPVQKGYIAHSDTVGSTVFVTRIGFGAERSAARIEWNFKTVFLTIIISSGIARKASSL